MLFFLCSVAHRYILKHSFSASNTFRFKKKFRLRRANGGTGAGDPNLNLQLLVRKSLKLAWTKYTCTI